MKRTPKQIIVFIDPDTREVQIDVPVPEGGPVQIEQVAGTSDKAVLRFDKATVTQKAHYHFWGNGMREQLGDITRQAPHVSGVRQTLRWILSMRIAEVTRKTGFTYQLVFMSDKKDWEQFKKMNEGAAA